MITKKAISSLKEKIKLQDGKRRKVLQDLLENSDFEKNYALYKNLIIQKSKAEFENQKFDESQLETCKKNLEKIISENSEFKTTPLSLLEPVVVCKKCMDNFFVDGKPCSCLKSEISMLLRQESNLKNFQKFSDSNFDVFDDKKKYQNLYAFAENWCKNPLNNKVVNFGFFGNTGNGKTFLMQCMADELVQNGYCIYFTTAFNMLDKIFKGNAENESELIKKFIDCDILFIDDLGTEKFFKNQNENYLYTIVNQRMITGKPIIFSTNLELQDFYERYGERIFSRLVNKQKSKIFWFDQKDLRMK